MKNTGIKICGITTPAEAEFLNRLRPDYIGMVLFFEKSRRNLSPDDAEVICQSVAPGIKKVAVMVAPTPEQALRACEAGFDLLQIHGKPDEKVFEVTDIPIIKAFNVTDMPDMESYRNNPRVEGFLLDAHTPGSGQLFDHSILKGLDMGDKKFILAGGLNPENVADAIREVSPDVVDVSSGVEYDSGRGKDPEKVKRFFKAVRG